MFKKLQLLLILLFVSSVPLAAQYTHAEISYQSFRPFVHFQLDFGNTYTSYHHNTYESAYLKGYMDGVNESYYYNHRFADLVRDQRIYEEGYRDGLRDQRLLIQLRGRSWYQRHRFGYDDYYSPSYSVRIWLDGLSLAFLQAPAYRLPHNWKRRAHHSVITYRNQMHRYRYKKGGRTYFRANNIERRFKKRVRGYKKRALKERNSYRKKGYRSRSNRSITSKHNNRGFKQGNHKRKFSRTTGRKNHKVKSRKSRDRKVVKKARKRSRSRAAVSKKRSGKKQKTKRSRSRSRKKRGNGNH